MITVKSCNEFGRVIRSHGLGLFGGARHLSHAIANSTIAADECSGVHISITVPHDIDRPTALFDAITTELRQRGIERIRLTIHSPRHTVQVGARSFSLLD